MEVRYERDGAGLATIQAEVPAELVDEAFGAAVKELRRHVNVPGFRPGRVPPKMVEGIVGADRVAEYAKELLEERVYPETIREVPRLVPLDEPRIELGKLTRGEPAEATITVLTAEVQLEGYQGVAIERYRAAVTPDEARSELEDHWRRHAEHTDADHDDVRQDDFVVFALRIIGQNGLLIEDYGEDDPLRVHIGHNDLTPSLDEHLLGLAVGQSSTFELTYPEDFGDEELAGQTAEFTVTVVAVQERQPLEEFVTEHLGAPSLDEALDEVAAQIERERGHRFRIMAREQLVAKLLQQTTIDMPRAQLDAAVMEEIEEFEEALEGRGVELPEDELEAHEDEIRERVEYDQRRRVLLRAVAQAEDLQVSREDLAFEVAMIAAANQIEPRLMMRRLEEQGLLPQVVGSARLRLAAERLLELADVTEVDPPADEDAAPEEAPGAQAPLGADVAASEAAGAAASTGADEAAETAEPEDEPCP